MGRELGVDYLMLHWNGGRESWSRVGFVTFRFGEIVPVYPVL